MFTTVMSRMIMSWALSMMASAIPGRPLGLSGAREKDKMPPRLSGHAISTSGG
jgi:hypothetical protein